MVNLELREVIFHRCSKPRIDVVVAESAGDVVPSYVTELSFFLYHESQVTDFAGAQWAVCESSSGWAVAKDENREKALEKARIRLMQYGSKAIRTSVLLCLVANLKNGLRIGR